MMFRTCLPAVALIFAVGCSATANGTLVDGITSEPIPGAGEGDDSLRLVAEAVKEKEDGTFESNTDAGLTCMTFSSEIGLDGTFSLSGLCLSGTGYRLRLNDNDWFLGETDFLPQGTDVSQPMKLKAWHAPMGSGIKILREGDHVRVTSRVNLRSETIKGTEDEKVHYPEGLPGSVPLIAAGESLVISGTGNKALKLVPIINSGPREFKIEEGMESGPTMDAWSYMGVRFTDDSNFERVQAKIDESKVEVVEHRNHFAKFVPADAVSPPGRYALYKEGEKAAIIVDFLEKGAAPGAADQAEAPAEGDEAAAE